MTIRILFATREQHPTFRADVAVLFGKYLPRLGIASDLLALTPSHDPPAWPGGSVHLLRAPSRGWRKFIASLVQDLRLPWLAFGPCSIVQVRDNALGALIGLVSARLTRKPFCYWMSFPFAEAWMTLAGEPLYRSGSLRSKLKFLQGWIAHCVLYQLVLPSADHVFVQSERMAEDVAKKIGGGARVTPIPMGVDCEAISQTRERGVRMDLAGRRVIVYLGALERIRKPDLLLDALGEVLHKYPDTYLVLIGDSQNPADRHWLKDAIAQRTLTDHVLVTGWLPTSEAWQWLRSAEIGLTPFPRDPYFDSASPTKAVEYLAHGLPVVANDQPDQAYVIRESGGGVIVPLTPNGFADGICRLLADPDAASAMGRRGREWVRRTRGYEVLADTVAETYRRLIVSRSSRAADRMPVEGVGKR